MSQDIENPSSFEVRSVMHLNVNNIFGKFVKFIFKYNKHGKGRTMQIVFLSHSMLDMSVENSCERGTKRIAAAKEYLELYNDGDLF